MTELTIETLLGTAARYCAWRLEPPRRKDREGVWHDITDAPIGQWRKVPHRGAGAAALASSNDPRTWIDLETATGVAALLRATAPRLPEGVVLPATALGGVGVFLGPVEGGSVAEGPGVGAEARLSLAGLDLDWCAEEGRDGALTWWANESLCRVDSRSEWSPSGKGVKVWFLIRAEDEAEIRRVFGIGIGADGGTLWKRKVEKGSGKRAAGIEVYFNRRWFALTWELLEASGEKLALLDIAVARRLMEIVARVRSEEGGDDGGVTRGARGTGAVDRNGGEDGDDDHPNLNGEVAALSTGAVMTRVMAALEADRKLGRRWNGDVAGLVGGQSRSELAMAIGAGLRARGLGLAEVCVALRECTALGGWVDEKGEIGDWREVRRIWRKGLSGVAPFGPIAGIGVGALPNGHDTAAQSESGHSFGHAGEGEAEESSDGGGSGADADADGGADADGVGETGEDEAPDIGGSGGVDEDGGDGRPTIRIVAGTAYEMAEACATAIDDAWRGGGGTPLFERGEGLVQPLFAKMGAADGKTTCVPVIRDVDFWTLYGLAGVAAGWTRWDVREKEWRRSNPDKDVIHVLENAKGLWPFPYLAGVTATPTIRPDGSLVAEWGYDAITQLYLMHDGVLGPVTVPEKPTRKDALAALGVLKGLLVESPFVEPVDRSVALSLMMSPVLRGAVPRAPLHAISAPKSGSGKSHIANLSSTIATGQDCPAQDWSPNAEENEKLVKALALDGAPLIGIDNISMDLGGDTLNKFLDQTYMGIRPLGHSQIRIVECRSIVSANGNNLTVRADMVRRTLLSRIDTGMEQPFRRKYSFNPIEEVRKNRARYVQAILTISRAYTVADRPCPLDPLASYAEWSRHVRELLVWLDEDDPLLSQRTVEDDDPESFTIRQIYHGWSCSLGEKEGFSVAGICQRTATTFGSTSPEGQALTEFRAALLTVAAGHRGEIDPKKLGYWLRKHKHVRIDGLVLVGAGYDNNHVLLWRVEKLPVE